MMSVLAGGLALRGHEVTLVTDYSTPNEYPLLSTVKRVNIDGEFKGISNKGVIKRTLGRIKKVRNICKHAKADLLISFMWNSNLRAVFATRFIKTKNLVSVRVDPSVEYRSEKTAFLAKRIYSMADGCVFQTEDAQSWFSTGIQKKSRVIFNPVSDSFYQTELPQKRTKRIVSCGRLDEQKRFDMIIDAFSKICDDFPEYHLEIYGQGDLQPALQEQIEKLNRQNRIFLMGRSEDVPNTIKDASLFVLASDYEGLPNALMEAMALGLPVISTDCGGGGARALIDHGKDGLIVPCGNVDALAQAIRCNLEDPETAKLRGENAGKKAAGFSTEHIVSLWEAYIAEIVAK